MNADDRVVIGFPFMYLRSSNPTLRQVKCMGMQL